MKFRSLAVAAVTALSLTALAACGSSDGDSNAAAGPTTIDVWLMKGSVSDDFLQRFTADFAAKHPDIKANVQIQEWNGIGPKIIGALASKDAPDVIEVGNTQVAQYSASGGVKDLTDKKADLKGDDWIEGLAGPGNYEGKQYGIPYYAANRVVIYRKDLFQAAGVTPPKTRAEWLAASAKLNTGGNQGIYLPGQNFYVLSGFIWDEGGDLAVKEGDSWKGALSTPEALKGMEFYRQIQALGKGPKDSDEAKPTQTDVFAQGKVAQMIAVPGAAELIAQANPALKDKLGFFPIPGKTADKPGAVFTGGSDLIIPEASDGQDAAYTFIKELAGEQWQTDLAKTMKYVPNRKALATSVGSDEGVAAMAAGAANGKATPNSPNWAAVEAKNPIKEYQTKVLTGGDPVAAAKAADEIITQALNAK
ncbi:extracellular solute-binding protein family 1 [Kribbella flavida DSM 17836]|uniref:Extracellular solute-binding protein family 1 n=1 Tax=Kribbella flavida (strain DSM 17836 / JCM 10339 / NBRC 14399) TaxID=479435 RepID=D2PQL3_KRIFD|nr:extracellular solute-binding protein [Kribbella flavida]ADB29200.1 extracellular solute-binding protein family 1 [Kribbella flavida DSM 17836]